MKERERERKTERERKERVRVREERLFEKKGNRKTLFPPPNKKGPDARPR